MTVMEFAEEMSYNINADKLKQKTNADEDIFSTR
jgi:hypothetical protein